MPGTLKRVKPIKLSNDQVGGTKKVSPTFTSATGQEHAKQRGIKKPEELKKHKKPKKRKKAGFIKTLYALVDAALYLYQANKAYRLEQGIGVRKEYERIRKSLILEKSTIATMRSQFQTEVDALFRGDVLSFTIQLNPDVAKYFDSIKNAVEYKYLVFSEIEPLKYKVTIDESYMKEWNF